MSPRAEAQARAVSRIAALARLVVTDDFGGGAQRAALEFQRAPRKIGA
jgi:hypothetical protein